jgi:enterochelin esterase-like enzyme
MSYLQHFLYQSPSLRDERMLSVFLPFEDRDVSACPVVFCADGQAVHGFSDELWAAIQRQEVPPVVLIGVHSHPAYRSKEYVENVNAERFSDHEHFFANEIYAWAATQFNLCLDRSRCAVFGFSNGGAFALSMGAKYREKYGVVIAFSIAGGPNRVPPTQYARRPIAKYYLSAGTREKPFLKTVQAVAQILDHYSVEHCQTERCAGHDFDFWSSELRLAIRWAFR